MTGEAQQAFYDHHDPSDSYIINKTKLLKWYEESKERRKTGSKAMFAKAVHAPDESV